MLSTEMIDYLVWEEASDTPDWHEIEEVTTHIQEIQNDDTRYVQVL